MAEITASRPIASAQAGAPTPGACALPGACTLPGAPKKEAPDQRVPRGGGKNRLVRSQ
jgi:hypothetical protein